MSVGPGIVIPLVVLPAIAIGVLVWYRRKVASLQHDDAAPAMSGVRLTAETLHRLPAPAWRVVFETSGHLGDVDHVVIGPSGVIAITTTMSDRPDRPALLEAIGEPQLVAQAAIARGDVDDLAARAGARCDVWARVHWGAPDASRPPAEVVVTGSLLVEGQRLEDWVRSTAADPPRLSPSEIVVVWRAIVTGIGRPDPTG